MQYSADRQKGLAAVCTGLAITLACGMVTLLLLVPGIAQAQQPWTTVGSTGTVDEQDGTIVEFVNGEVRVPAGAVAPATLNIRYNIVAVDDIIGAGQYQLTSRFRDNGNGAQVRLLLKSYNLTTGITSTEVTFDSNSFPPAVGYQTRSVCFLFDFDFDDHAYFIDAELRKTSADGTPALGIIQIRQENCVP